MSCASWPFTKAVLQNVPVAMNRSSADFIFSSPLMAKPYTKQVYDYATRLKRKRVIDTVRENEG